MIYVGMIETRSLKILLKSFHENYSDLSKETTWYLSRFAHPQLKTQYIGLKVM